MDLKDKVIVVVGGGGLLGSAFVEACTNAGAQVVVADITEPTSMHAGAVFMQCDALDEGQVAALAQEIKNKYKKVDGVINATYPAATRSSDNGDFEHGGLDDKLESVSRHLKVCFTIVRGFAPVMKGCGGSIVFLASIYGVVAPRFDLYEGLPMTQPAEYAAAKGGVIAATRYFASRYGRDGIRCNVISPGGIAADQPKEFVERYAKRVLLGTGLLQPEDIAGAAVFLLSDASAKVTGQNIIVDAGWTL